MHELPLLSGLGCLPFHASNSSGLARLSTAGAHRRVAPGVDLPQQCQHPQRVGKWGPAAAAGLRAARFGTRMQQADVTCCTLPALRLLS